MAPATALAALAHLAALLAVGWRVPIVAEKREADFTPPVEITLVHPPRPVRTSIPAARTAPAPKSSAERSSLAPAPLLQAPTQPAPAPTPATPRTEAAPGDENLRSVLRGLIGCSDPRARGLSREERAACDQRLAAAKPAPVGSEVSAEELAQFNAGKTYDPVFTRKAHNGCLPHVGDRLPGGGGVGLRSGARTAFGLSCAWSF